jgi:hypothetical protein
MCNDRFEVDRPPHNKDDDSCAGHEGSFNYYTECNEQSNRTVNY